MNILRQFIVFEGIDGSGTTTQLTMLKSQLKSQPVWFTAEPSTRETGLFLRRVLKGEFSFEAQTVAHLFAADRSEHLYGTDGVLDHIKQGHAVISDRYIFSSLAYQSLDCGYELPAKLNADFPLPEIVFFFDIDPILSLNRITSRNVTEIYEKIEILQKVASAYRSIFDAYERQMESESNGAMRIIRIDASLPIEKVSQKIYTILQDMPIFNR